jgi:hypothetical protein
MSKKELRLSDQVIGQIREVLQLSLLTQTNFVDHMRALRVEESEKTDGVLILSEGYVTGWNEMAEKFHTQALAKAEELASNLATDQDEEVVESDEEVVISRDPATGKLVGTRQKAN